MFRFPLLFVNNKFGDGRIESRRNGAAVLLYHLKPAFVPQLKKELADLQEKAK